MTMRTKRGLAGLLCAVLLLAMPLTSLAEGAIIFESESPPIEQGGIIFESASANTTDSSGAIIIPGDTPTANGTADATGAIIIPGDSNTGTGASQAAQAAGGGDAAITGADAALLDSVEDILYGSYAAGDEDEPSNIGFSIADGKAIFTWECKDANNDIKNYEVIVKHIAVAGREEYGDTDLHGKSVLRKTIAANTLSPAGGAFTAEVSLGTAVDAFVYGNTYQIFVKAITTANPNGIYSDITYTYKPTTPPAPTLTATLTGATVELSLASPYTGSDNHDVTFYQNGVSIGTPVGTDPTTSGQLTVTPGETYTYTATAYYGNAVGDGNNLTGTCKLTVPPSVPTIGAITSVGATSMIVPVTAGTGNTDSIELEWSTNPLFTTYENATLSASPAYFSLTGLTPDTGYFVRARARVDEGIDQFYSVYSATATATTDDFATPVTNVKVTPVNKNTLHIAWDGIGMPHDVESYHIIIKHKDTNTAERDIVRYLYLPVNKTNGDTEYGATINFANLDSSVRSELNGHTLVHGNEYLIAIKPHINGVDRDDLYSYAGYRLDLPDSLKTLPGLTATRTATTATLAFINAQNLPAGTISGPHGLTYYRNGVKVGALTGINPTDASLVPGTTYTYYAEAYYGNATSSYMLQTPTVTITTPPAPPTYTNEQETSFSISFDVVAPIGNYDAFYVEDENGNVTTFTQGGAYAIEGLTAGKEYTFKLYSKLNGIVSEVTELKITTPTTGMVTNLVATAISSERIDLRWDAYTGANYPTVTGYDIYRMAPGESSYILRATVGATTTTYIDTPLAAGATYYYRIVAKLVYTSPITGEVAGSSLPSDAATATTPIVGAPTLTATISGINRIDLRWTAVGNASKYTITRSEAGATPVVIYTATAAEVYWSDTSVKPNTTYTYTLTAVTASGATVTSNAATVRTTLSLASLVTATRSSASRRVIIVSWQTLPYATGYRIERSTSEYGAYTTIYTATSGAISAYEDTLSSYGTTYYYRVIPLYGTTEGIAGAASARTGSSSSSSSSSSGNTSSTNNNGSLSSTVVNNQYSGNLTNVDDQAVPKAGPSSAQRVAFNLVSVTWTGVSGAAGYTVTRSNNVNGPFETVGKVGADVTNFVDGTAGIAPGTYYYRVAASMTAGSRAPEIAMETSASLGAVQNLTLAPTESGSLLRWSVYDGATEYHVFTLEADATWTRQALLFGGDNCEYMHGNTFDDGTPISTSGPQTYFIVAVTRQGQQSDAYASAVADRAIIEKTIDGGWQLYAGEAIQYLSAQDAVGKSAVCLGLDRTSWELVLSVAAQNDTNSDTAPVWPLDTSLLAEQGLRIGRASNTVTGQ